MRIASRWLVTAIIALSFLAMPQRAPAQVYVGFSVGLFVNVAPPPIPVYYQPPPPGAGYIWIPGYWAWGPGGYYWVPGYWEVAPYPGYYWTPGYWSWDPYCGCYDWNNGYWGPQVGFYGGINYGFGYFGIGYVGGYWHNGAFWYNRAVTNVGVAYVHDVYTNRTEIASHRVWSSRVAYNGGPRGDPARPNHAQLAVSRMHHISPTPAQIQHAEWAGKDRNYLYSVNRGRPSDPAVTHPFTASRRPAHFTPVTAHDQATARTHVIPTHNGKPVITHHATTVYHAAPVVHHAAPVVHHAAPAYHPAPPQYHAPAYHAPVHHAPAYHAPAYHPAAPRYHAPAYHAPAYHAAAVQHGAPHPAPRRSAEPR